MKRKVLLSADDQAVAQSPSQLPVLKPVGKLNPAPSESNQETSFIPTKEEKETITMKDDSMPSIETSFFSGSSDEQDAAEDGRIDWTKPKQREEESDLMKDLVKKFQSSTPGVGGEDELVSTTENNEHNGDVKVDQQKIFKFVHEGNSDSRASSQWSNLGDEARQSASNVFDQWRRSKLRSSQQHAPPWCHHADGVFCHQRARG